MLAKHVLFHGKGQLGAGDGLISWSRRLSVALLPLTGSEADGKNKNNSACFT